MAQAAKAPRVQPAAGRSSQPATTQIPATLRPPPKGDAGARKAKGWWQDWGDPKLAAYVDRALRQNQDLRLAAARIDESKNVAAQTLAPLLPRLDLEGNVTVGPLDSLGFQFGGRSRGSQSQMGAAMGPPPDLPTLYVNGSATLAGSLNLDVAGRQRLQRKAAFADVDAQELSLRQQRHQLVTNVVSAYFNIVAARAQYEITQQQRQSVLDILELTKRRFEIGRATALDILSQRQQLAAIESRLPQAKLQVRAFSNQLAILLGEVPGQDYPSANDLKAVLAAKAPPLSEPAPQGRFAVRLAKAQLKASELRSNNLARSWTPTLQLTGRYGIQGIYLGSTRTQWFWNIGANLRFPLYQGGQAKQQREQARLQLRNAKLEWERQQLVVRKEFADAKAQIEYRGQIRQAMRAQERAAKEAFEESKRSYFAGLSEYTAVLQALSSWQAVQLNQVTTRRDQLAAILSLRALVAESSASGKQRSEER